MEELLKVGVVDVGEDPEELAVEVLASEDVVFGKVVGACGERGWVIEKMLGPGEDEVDVDGCGELDWLAVGIYPCIVEPAGTGNVGGCLIRGGGWSACGCATSERASWPLTWDLRPSSDTYQACRMLIRRRRTSSSCCKSRTLGRRHESALARPHQYNMPRKRAEDALLHATHSRSSTPLGSRTSL